MLYISEDCEAFLSETGHKDFLYPSKKSVKLQKGLSVSRIHWVGISGLIPVKVETKKIFELYQIERKREYSVIWIKKEYIYNEFSSCA